MKKWRRRQTSGENSCLLGTSVSENHDAYISNICRSTSLRVYSVYNNYVSKGILRRVRIHDINFRETAVTLICTMI